MKTLDDLVAELEGDPAKGRCVFVRADLNVPLDGTTITDDGRIRASLPTIQRLRDAHARVVVAAHLGRPKAGADNSKYSLAPVAARLGSLLGTDVLLAQHGDEAQTAVERLTSGGVVLLENIRFDPRETSKDDDERAEFAGELAALTGTEGVFVSDGFGVVHRKQASVYDLARELPAYAGGLVLTEVEVLRKLSHDPQRPYAVVLGGSKVSDKLLVIESLLPQVDSLLVGGGMCFTFLAAQGLGVGDSLLEDDQIGNCRRLLESGKIVLPTDVVVADDFSAAANTRTVPVEKIPDGWKGLDIGPESVAAFADVLVDAKTVFWNGPMGVFELAPFAEGTRGVAQAIVDATAPGNSSGSAFSVVGGGDSAAAVRQLGLPEDGFSHISTGGGASLEYLEGKVLPGIAVLDEEKKT